MCETLAIVGIVALLAYSAWWKHRTRLLVIRRAQLEVEREKLESRSDDPPSPLKS